MKREDVEKGMGEIVRIDEGKIRSELGELVRGTVEETLNGLLDAEASELCNAKRYERRESAKTRGRGTTRASWTRRQGR